MAFGRNKKSEDGDETPVKKEKKGRRKKQDETVSDESVQEESGRESARARRKREKEEAKVARTFTNYPFLRDFKPKEKYVFHSDYFQIDKRFATIMSFFHIEGAQDNFDAFWGVNKIATGLDNDITIVLFDQIHRMPENWVSDHKERADGINQMTENENKHAASRTSKAKASATATDLEQISKELLNGGSYLHVHYRVMLTASTLDKLDKAVSQLEHLYAERFATLSIAPYVGEQRRELSALFAKNDKKEGHGFYFTSQEFAGSYNLVTHGLEDPDGEYVGYMVGDVNNSAVIFNPDNYSHHVVIADESYGHRKDRARTSSIWGSKLSQSALMNNHRVIHVILDGTNLDALGPKFASFTSRIDMNHGDVNMFEMFGRREDQLSIFPRQMQKLILMAEQAFETTDSDRSIIRTSLEEIATRYYIDNRMWYDNAGQNQDRIRIVGIPHKEVPKLEMFVAYLDKEYKSMASMTARDDEKLHALSVLLGTFRNMLSNNGDLFNTITKDNIDSVSASRRVIYDFSQLLQRGTGVAMAQLVNIIGFAVGNLQLGDVVIFHGGEKIAPGVKDYIKMQLATLYDHGGRSVWLYNNVQAMLDDKDFCKFDQANYTIFGNMTNSVCREYQASIGQKIPGDLARLITTKNDCVAYIRRGFDNVVFHRSLSIGDKGNGKGG